MTRRLSTWLVALLAAGSGCGSGCGQGELARAGGGDGDAAAAQDAPGDAGPGDDAGDGPLTSGDAQPGDGGQAADDPAAGDPAPVDVFVDSFGDAGPDGDDPVTDDPPTSDPAVDAPPTGPFADMLLRASGGQLVGPDGSAVDFRGAISCCGGGYGWPLFDESWVDLVDVYGVNFLHMRLGPFLTGANGESDWAAVGGGYAAVDGQADLTRFNAAFWARVRALIEYAGERGMWVEVDVADGWAIKHCRWGDIPGYSAWDPAWNVQGEDWCSTGGSREILGGDVHEQWVRQVVRETGRYGNVIYQDGNEVGIVGGYAPEWTLSIRNIVRDEEARNGFGRHLYGTNSEHATAMGADGVEFIELHQEGAPDPAGCFGRPCLSNEYNPDPALSPEAFQARYCAARAAGTYFWYWRHGQSAEQMEASLALMTGGCP